MKEYKQIFLVLTILKFLAATKIEQSASFKQNNITNFSNNNQRRNVEKTIFKQINEKDYVDNDDSNNADDDYSSEESSSKTTIPLIVPAPARITISLNAKKILKKRKKNFSKMAKSLIILNETDFEEFKRYLNTNNDTYKFARSFTKSIQSGKQRLKLFELGGYCNQKEDGLHDDPEDCENFIICFADRTFRTKCAYGTLWNHITKECDFPEKVDCLRRPTTLKTDPSTSTIETTITTGVAPTRVPKISYFTVPIPKNKTLTSMANLASIKTNILLTTIIVPLAILIVVFIIVSVWFWNDKFSDKKPKKFDKKVDNGKNFNETIYGNEKGHIKNKNEMLFRRLSFCKCYKKFSSFNFSQKEKACREKFMKSCVGAKSADRVRINSITSNTQTETHISNPKREINFIDIKPINYINTGAQQPNEKNAVNNEIEEKVDIDTLTSTAMGIDECQIASESQLTLASHFEENNWDYNFATRGLYLNQPWGKGRYGKNFDGSEHSDTFSASKCGVLTLEAVKDDYTFTPNDVTKIIRDEPGEGDDTDGYYA